LLPPEADHLTSFISNGGSEEDTTDSSDEYTNGSGGVNTGGSVFQEIEQAAVDDLKVLVATHIKRNKLVTEELLRKSLRARDGKPLQAKRLIKSYLDWYDILTSGNPIKISDVRRVLESRIIYFIDGATDKDGRSMIFYDSANYRVDGWSEPELIRCLVYCLERITERQEVQTKGIVILSNMVNWSMANFSMRVGNSFFSTLRKYFPVILHKLYFIDAPSWISRVMTLCQPFISTLLPAIELISSQALFERVDIANLPTDLRGEYALDLERWIRTRHEIEGVEYLN